MSALLTRPRLTARERTTMTPEQELELLDAEQARDDARTWAETPPWQVSLDAPAPGGGRSGEPAIGADLVGRDPWSLVDDVLDLGLDPAEVAYAGDLVDSMPPDRGLLRGQGLIDVRDIPHATAGGYQNHRCRCIPCTNSWAAYKRERRAVRKAARS